VSPTPPPFGSRTNAASVRSISPASRTSIGVNSTPNAGAAGCTAANWAIPPVVVESRNTATRAMRGASSFKSSSDFARRPNSWTENPVTLPPGRAQACNQATADWVGGSCKHDGDAAGDLQQGLYARGDGAENDVWRQRNQFGRVPAGKVRLAGGPANIELHVAADGPALF